MPIELETERLRLRKFRPSDWDPYAAMCADAEVMRYLGTGVVITRDEAWRSMATFLGHWQLKGYGMWGVEARDSGELVGRVGFIDVEGWPGFELGWLIARPHWGHGYAIEAAKAAYDYAIGTLERDRVISLILPGNERSMRVATKLGFVRDGMVDMMGRQALVYADRRTP